MCSVCVQTHMEIREDYLPSNNSNYWKEVTISQSKSTTFLTDAAPFPGRRMVNNI